MTGILILLLLLLVLVFGIVKAMQKKGQAEVIPDKPLPPTKLPPVYTQVAGTAYANGDTGEQRQKLIKKHAKVGMEVKLIPDLRNTHDPHAMKVCLPNDKQIGFLDMDLAIEIKSRLHEGNPVEARIVNITEDEKLEVTLELIKKSRRARQ